MKLKSLLFVAGGAAAAGTVATLAHTGCLRKATVAAAAQAMRVSDAVATEAQNIVDDAADLRAEARRQAKIDAAVAERLAALEEGIRAEVVAEVDAEVVE